MNSKLRFCSLLLLLTALSALLIRHDLTALHNRPQPLRLGVSHGTEAEIAYKVRELALQQNLSIEIFVYGDYLKLNRDLYQKKLDAVSFQPLYYLEAVNRDLAYDLFPLQKTIFSPLGLYSRAGRSETAQPIKPQSSVLIARESEQQSRSLELLQDAGLISLNVPSGALATLSDIAANPLQLELKSLFADDMQRQGLDCSYLVLNASQAQSLGWQPQKEALFLEKPAEKYLHVLAIRQADLENGALQKLSEIYASPDLRRYILEVYKGRWLPASQ